MRTLIENLALTETLSEQSFTNYDIIQTSVHQYTTPRDIIIENPPFGTREKGTDTAFLEHALSLAPIVYSFHKTATEKYVQHIITKNEAICTNTYPFSFPLKKTLPGHKRKIHRIAVSCYRITRQPTQPDPA